MLPCVCSVIDHRWRQNVVKRKKWHTSRRRVCHWCFYQMLTSSVIYYWTDPRQHGIYFFHTMIRKEKTTDTHTCTCLVPLDCLRLCTSLGSINVPNASFRLCFFFFFFILPVYSFFEKNFNVFSCSKQNNGVNILQNCESHSYDTRWQLLWTFLVV